MRQHDKWIYLKNDGNKMPNYMYVKVSNPRFILYAIHLYLFLFFFHLNHYDLQWINCTVFFPFCQSILYGKNHCSLFAFDFSVFGEKIWCVGACVANIKQTVPFSQTSFNFQRRRLTIDPHSIAHSHFSPPPPRFDVVTNKARL